MSFSDSRSEYSDQLDLFRNFKTGHATSFNQLKRSSFSQPREAGAELHPSTRRRFSANSRSKSAGRDPRLTDLARVYQAGQEATGAAWSTTSGRLGWEGNTDDNVSLYSGRSDHNSYGVGILDTVSEHNPIRSTYSLDNRSVHSLDNRSVHSLDNRSVSSWDNRSVQSLADNRSVHSLSDNRSVRSLENHLLNWSPITRDSEVKLSGKRKYSTFDEAISDDDDNISFVAKRPRTPENFVDNEVPDDSSRLLAFLRKLVKSFFKMILIFLCGITLLLGYAMYKNFQCSYKQSRVIDINLIEKELSSNLFGQHLAHAEIVSSITSFTQSTNTSPLLILVLFGWLGSGKTHSARLISSLLPHQSNSHFISCSLPQTLQGVGSRVARDCGYSMIVLDDLDSADNDTLNMIEDLVVSINNDENSKSNGTIIVATTSAGGHAVNKLILERARTSTASRDMIKYDDVMEALNDQRDSIPLYKSLLAHNLPVRLIPFMPLTRDHLRKCAKKVAGEQGLSITDKQMNHILDQVHYFSKDFPMFAKTGCKQISTKVDLLMGGSLEL